MDDAADAAGDDPIVALEKRFRSRIVALKRQLEDRERRATNAKYVNEANEALAAEHGHDEVVQLLCERGGAAQLHAADETGKTALHVACAKGHEHVARALLGAGAHANVVDRTGSTPLHVVAATKHVRLARLLVDRGADLALRNREEHTALDAARAHENRAVIELLAPLVARALGKGASKGGAD